MLGRVTRPMHAICWRHPCAAASAWPQDPTSWTRCFSTTPAKARNFHLLVVALQTFHAAKGHFLVPYHYPIPMKDTDEQRSHDDASRKAPYPFNAQQAVDSRGVAMSLPPARAIDWPADVRGMNLGRTLHAFMTNRHHQLRYPQVVSTLRGIGFPVDIDWKQYVWKHLQFASLEAFYELEGHAMVPIHFVVPTGDAQWPRQTWGYRLGPHAHALRQRERVLEAYELEDLRRIGFSFDVIETTWSEKILPALKVFVREYGHCLVKYKFEVPSTPPWPVKAYGLNLGAVVNAIRSRGIYSEQITRDADILHRLGFVWDVNGDKWSKMVLPALEVFAQLHGHCRVPRGFVVPSESHWPERAWGINLGVVVNHMRSSGGYAKEMERDRDRLEATGFAWNPREEKWSELILPSLEAFMAVYGHVDVPRRFVVPENHARWPTQAGGLKLGVCVHEMRYNDAYATFVANDRDRLQAIGFPHA